MVSDFLFCFIFLTDHSTEKLKAATHAVTDGFSSILKV